MKKRLLSILLCCVMLLGLLPTAAFAADSAEAVPVAYETGNTDGTNALDGTSDEQFSLTPGGTYYFDLSGVNIPKATGNQHYVPFTYAGTVNAYVLNANAKGVNTASAEASAATDSSAQYGYTYAHSLFIADQVVTSRSWDTLNSNGLIYGKDYTSGGISYSLRAPSGGSTYPDTEKRKGAPQNNEWDTIQNKNAQFIKVSEQWTWAQDMRDGSTIWYTIRRAVESGVQWSSAGYNVVSEKYFRPVLEVLNADTLGADALKAVTLELGGGKVTGSEASSIQIIVKNGESFTAPSKDGLTRPSTGSYFMWLGSDGKLYAPGATVPAEVTGLTAQWTDAPPSHTHVWAEAWSSDGAHHWHECTAEGCDITDNAQKDGYAAHSGEDDGNCTTAVDCDTCGYQIKAAELEHRYPDTWTPVRPGTSHTRTCQNEGCGMTKSGNCVSDGKATCQEFAKCTLCGGELGTKADHDFTAETVGEDYLKSAATCTEKAVYYKSCSVCALSSQGMAKEATFESGEVDADNHTGSLGEDWKSNTDKHWKEYTCCHAKAEEADHVYDDDADMECNICGYHRGKAEVKFNSITAVGNGDENWLNGANWDPAAAANHMTETAPNVYEITYTGIAAYDHYWVKFAADDGWTDNWGAEDSTSLSGNAVYNEAGIEFSVETDNSTVKIVLDLSKYDPDTKTGATYSVTITPPQTHTHTWAAKWSGDGTHHWHECTAEGCDITDNTQKDGYAAHTGGTATCTEKAACEVCGEHYGEVDPDNHAGGTELKNKKDATCTEKGYTGDTYCKGCGEKLSDGKDIPMLDHDYSDWTIIRKPTAVAKGERERTCATCGDKQTEVLPATGKFDDVPAGSYYEDAVIWAATEGITNGTDTNRFSPNDICNRAEAVTFLWRFAGSPAPKTSTMPFTDVPAGSFYYDAVLWAVENGITTGTDKTTFSPSETCTRAQVVTLLWRYEKSPAAESSSPFTDVAPNAYYASAVQWAVENGITTGTDKTTFSPNNGCSRAQIVTFLWRFQQ